MAYPDRRVGARAPTTVSGAGSAPVLAELVWRDGACAHLVVVRGRCPAATDEVLVSERSATQDPGLVLGGRIGVTPAAATGAATTGVAPPEDSATPAPPQPVVVGTYRLVDDQDPFWAGHLYTPAHRASLDGALDTVDDVFTTQATFTELTTGTRVSVDVDQPLDRAAVRWSSASGVDDRVRQLDAAYGADDLTRVGATLFRLTTGVPGVLAQARAERRDLQVATALVTVLLAALAWAVLFQVMGDAVEARRSELALAKLRGFGLAATLRQGLVEPAALLVLAVPIGVAAAWVATRALVAGLMRPGTPVVLTAGTAVAVLVALAGAAAAAAVTVARVVRRPLLEQLRRTRPVAGRTGVVGRIAEWMLAGVAVAGLVAVLTLHRVPSALVLAVAAVAVAAAAVGGVRLVPALARTQLRGTRSSRRLGRFLAVRTLARRPAALRLTVLLTVAVGLAALAVAGNGDARGNREARAMAEVGASQVVSVQADQTHDPVAAARAADPGGRWAMAAARWLPDGGQSVTGTVLGVDAARYAAVAEPVRSGLPAADVAADVVGSPAPTVPVAGSLLEVSLDVTALTGPAPPRLVVRLRTPADADLAAPGPALHLGRAVYPVDVPCAAGGCALAGITLAGPIDVFSDVTASVTVDAITQGADGERTALDAGLSAVGRWRPGNDTPDARSRVTGDSAGLHVDATMTGGADAAIAYGDVPAAVPVVASSRALVPDPGTLAVEDAIGVTARLDLVDTTPLLPAVLDTGVAADVDYLRAALPAFADSARWEIWLGRDAPADAVDRLRAAGALVERVATVDQRRAVLDRQGPALALDLLLAVAAAAALLTMGATAVAITASGRRRTLELAALRTVGVRRGVLVRAGALEQLALLGVAVVVGIPAGWVVARATMPHVPLFSDPTPVPASWSGAPGSVLLVAAGFVVLLTAVALVAAVSLVRSAVPTRLREVE